MAVTEVFQLLRLRLDLSIPVLHTNFTVLHPKFKRYLRPIFALCDATSKVIMYSRKGDLISFELHCRPLNHYCPVMFSGQ